MGIVPIGPVILIEVTLLTFQYSVLNPPCGIVAGTHSNLLIIGAGGAVFAVAEVEFDPEPPALLDDILAV